MLKVMCPSCHRKFQIVDPGRADSIIECTCGQKFRAGNTPSPSAIHKGPPAIPQNQPQELKILDDDTPAVSSYRRKTAGNPLVWILGGGGLAVLAVVLVIVYLSDSDSKTDADSSQAKLQTSVAEELEKKNSSRNDPSRSDPLNREQYGLLIMLTFLDDYLMLDEDQKARMKTLRTERFNEALNRGLLKKDEAYQMANAVPVDGPEQWPAWKRFFVDSGDDVRKLLTSDQRKTLEKLYDDGVLNADFNDPRTLVSVENLPPEVLQSMMAQIPLEQPEEPDPQPKPPAPPAMPLEQDPVPEDPEWEAVIAARKDHQEKLKQAKNRLEQAFSSEMVKASASDDLSLRMDLQQEMRAFATQDSLPKSEIMQPAAKEYVIALVEAHQELDATYQEKIQSYTKALQFEKARALLADQEALNRELQSLQTHLNIAELPPQDDPIALALFEAKQTHQSSVKDLKQKMLAWFDGEIKTVAATGDLTRVNTLEKMRNDFDSDGTVEGDLTKEIENQLYAYYREIDKLDVVLQGAYKTAITQYRRAKEDGKADRLAVELESGVGEEGGRWQVLFRSSNPRLWDSPTNLDPNNFSVRLSEAPEGIRFLRLTMLDRKPQSVIIPMSRNRLDKETSIGNFGWNGVNQFSWGGSHLGIWREDAVMKFPIPNEAKGMVGVKYRGFDSYLGWGFGHHVKIDQNQGYTWEGNTSVKPIVMEIAVTTRLLRPDDRKNLLVDKTQVDILPTSEFGPQEWRYTTTEPPPEWFQTDFDDTRWRTGNAAFGSYPPLDYLINTPWNTREIWLRRSFNWDPNSKPTTFKNPHLRVLQDESAIYYLNGEQIAQRDDSTQGKYELLPLNQLNLKPGANLLTVYCKGGFGPQIIDVGMVDLLSPR